MSEPAQSTREHSGMDEVAAAALVRKTRAPIELIKRLYDEEIAELQSKSSVKHFIKVIAGRRVRQRLAAAERDLNKTLG